MWLIMSCMENKRLSDARPCPGSMSLLVRLIVIIFLCVFVPASEVYAAKLPEATSTALKMHKMYTVQPPHETSLYDALQVLPNATLVQIQQAYRRRSRDLHPDKVRLRKIQRQRRREQERQKRQNEEEEGIFEASLLYPNHINSSGEYATDDGDNEKNENDGDIDSDGEEDECQRELASLREAYEVLKDDQTRLPYHRFGLVDTDTAAALLTGGRMGQNSAGTFQPSSEQERLLRWMGYDIAQSCNRHDSYLTDSAERHEQRVQLLASDIVELIRPYVEGSIRQEDLAQFVAAECNELKSSPLGAQIIRCIGRSYRHSGKKVLNQHRRRRKAGNSRSFQVGLLLADRASSTFRDVKSIMDAALTSGRLVLTEQTTKLGFSTSIAKGLKRTMKTMKEALPALDYHPVTFGEPLGDRQYAENEPPSTDELKEREQEKAQAAVIGALQVEALWKIVKIELDRTISEACSRILDGAYHFFPLHQPLQNRYDRYHRNEIRDAAGGWVGSTGEAIETDKGKLRAAAALVLVGQTMVDCSKDNTAWVD